MDFYKALELIGNITILDILAAKGFGERWINIIFSSGIFVVLLDQVPKKTFIKKEESDKGILVSPALCSCYTSRTICY